MTETKTDLEGIVFLAQVTYFAKPENGPTPTICDFAEYFKQKYPEFRIAVRIGPDVSLLGLTVINNDDPR